MPDYACPLCGGTLHVSASPRAKSGWAMICHTCERGEHWTRELAQAADAPSTWEFLQHPGRYLEPVECISRRGGPRLPGEGVELPSAARVDGWAERLFSKTAGTTNALRWLRRRGIVAREVRRWKVGWNGSELVLPLYERAGGENPERLVNLKRRFPADGHPPLSWPGVDAFPLFADGRERSIVLCEGELDALACRSRGIPATSVTIGEAGWREEWERALAGRRVAVCYDVGSEQYARAAVRALRRTRPSTAAGLLQLEGRHGYDLTDYLREHGRAALLRLLRDNTNWGKV